MKANNGMNLSTQYNLSASHYIKTYKEFNHNSIDHYFSVVPENLSGMKVIDLGCGNGEDIRHLKNRDSIICGVDSSMAMVNQAIELNPLSDIRCESFIKTTFETEGFDYVVSKWALQTAPDLDQVYKEVTRLLKPGGSFIFLVTHPMRHFMEKKDRFANYFEQTLVQSVLFNGEVIAQEPSHTLTDLLSSYFLDRFEIIELHEGVDEGAEQVNEQIYPSYLLVKAKKKKIIKNHL